MDGLKFRRECDFNDHILGSLMELSSCSMYEKILDVSDIVFGKLFIVSVYFVFM